MEKGALQLEGDDPWDIFLQSQWRETQYTYERSELTNIVTVSTSWNPGLWIKLQQSTMKQKPTGSLFPLRYTFTPRVEAATSNALLDIRATMSLSKVSILNLDKSGEKVIFVKSSPVWSLILGSEVLAMLLPQTYNNKIKTYYRMNQNTG